MGWDAQVGSGSGGRGGRFLFGGISMVPGGIASAFHLLASSSF